MLKHKFHNFGLSIFSNFAYQIPIKQGNASIKFKLVEIIYEKMKLKYINNKQEVAPESDFALSTTRSLINLGQCVRIGKRLLLVCIYTCSAENLSNVVISVSVNRSIKVSRVVCVVLG